MTPSTQDAWQRAVEACLDGALGPARDEAVRRHLEDCPDCDGHAQLLLAVRGSLQRVARRLPPLSVRTLVRLGDHLAGSGKEAPLGRVPGP
ncbi:MAG: zf-HC2 domain-containing protein [Nocardioidaceae bacterium]